MSSNVIAQHSIRVGAAETVIEHAMSLAVEIGAAVSIAVVDRGGHLVAFRRMDGAYPGSVAAGISKAQSCAHFRTPLAEFGKMAKREPWLGDLPGLIPLGGAMPLWADISEAREFVGAVSISGDTEEHEQQIAELIAANFEGRR